MATIRAFTTIEQSRKLAEILSLETADMVLWGKDFKSVYADIHAQEFMKGLECKKMNYVPCWSLAALLKLIPKHILRKDKIHCGQAFIPSFRWEITPTAIFYTDGNKIMDYVSFRYGENNIELIDAVFRMIVWLKKNNRL